MSASPTAAADAEADSPTAADAEAASKRLRTLRKKLQSIQEAEDSVVLGKMLNKEQQEMVKKKSSLVDEFKKLKDILRRHTVCTEETPARLIINLPMEHCPKNLVSELVAKMSADYLKDLCKLLDEHAEINAELPLAVKELFFYSNMSQVKQNFKLYVDSKPPVVVVPVPGETKRLSIASTHAKACTREPIQFLLRLKSLGYSLQGRFDASKFGIDHNGIFKGTKELMRMVVKISTSDDTKEDMKSCGLMAECELFKKGTYDIPHDILHLISLLGNYQESYDFILSNHPSLEEELTRISMFNSMYYKLEVLLQSDTSKYINIMGKIPDYGKRLHGSWYNGCSNNSHLDKLLRFNFKQQKQQQQPQPLQQQPQRVAPIQPQQQQQQALHGQPLLAVPTHQLQPQPVAPGLLLLPGSSLQQQQQLQSKQVKNVSPAPVAVVPVQMRGAAINYGKGKHSMLCFRRNGNAHLVTDYSVKGGGPGGPAAGTAVTDAAAAAASAGTPSGGTIGSSAGAPAPSAAPAPQVEFEENQVDHVFTLYFPDVLHEFQMAIHEEGELENIKWHKGPRVTFLLQ